MKRDADGMPVATMHYAPGENDRRMMNYMLDRLVDIGSAAGAFEVKLQDYRDKDGVYRTPAWHMIGTCRMGSDPETSVVNKWQQSWDVPNLFIVDGSVLATGGVVNPTPTISALALRAATHIRDNFETRQLNAVVEAVWRGRRVAIQGRLQKPWQPRGLAMTGGFVAVRA